MTSNQLQREANEIAQYNAEINKQNAETQERVAETNKQHLERMDSINEELAKITKAHNEAMEGFTAEQLRIDADRQEADKKYQQEQIRLNEWKLYNDMHNEAVRLAYEEMKARADAELKHAQAVATENETRLREEMNAETQRHNMESENLIKEQNEIKLLEFQANTDYKKLDVQLRNKELEYQKHQWDEMNTQNWYKLETERQKVEDERQMKIWNIQSDVYRFKMNALQFNKEYELDQMRFYEGTIKDLLVTTGAVGSALLNLITPKFGNLQLGGKR